MTKTEARSNIWRPQILRSLVLLVVGLAVTFSPNHDALLGFLSLGAIGVVGAVALVWESQLLEPGIGRKLALIEGVASGILGGLLLVFSYQEIGTLLLLGATFAGSVGLAELLRGALARGHRAEAKDWIIVGGLTCILALVLVLLPADFAEHWAAIGTAQSETGVLTSPIVAVGLIGAWAILAGVFLAIAALSNKWAAAVEADNGLERKGDRIE